MDQKKAFTTVFKCAYFDRCRRVGGLDPEHCIKDHMKIVEEDGYEEHCCRIDVDINYKNAYENLMEKIKIVHLHRRETDT